ncbi:MAG: hypothetical protein AB2556_02085 [Candidatus Thiodiazotropha sp.]
MDTSKLKDVEELQNRYSTLTRYLFALLTGAVVLFPTITGAFHPPYVFTFFLFSFWVFAVPGILLLAVGFYLAGGVRISDKNATEVERWLHRTGGLGNWSSLLALTSLVIYVIGNLHSDHTSAPRITTINANPHTVQQGQWISLSATANDQNKDYLTWNWELNKKTLGKLRTISWLVPDNEPIGEKNITLTVSDGEKTDNSQIKILVIKGGNTMAIPNEKQEELKHYVDDRMKLYLAKRERDNHPITTELKSSQSVLLKAALKNIHSLEAVRDEPSAITEALDAYYSLPIQELSAASGLPKCEDYPMLWPFCRS